MNFSVLVLVIAIVLFGVLAFRQMSGEYPKVCVNLQTDVR